MNGCWPWALAAAMLLAGGCGGDDGLPGGGARTRPSPPAASRAATEEAGAMDELANLAERIAGAYAHEEGTLVQVVHHGEAPASLQRLARLVEGRVTFHRRMPAAPHAPVVIVPASVAEAAAEALGDRYAVEGPAAGGMTLYALKPFPFADRAMGSPFRYSIVSRDETLAAGGAREVGEIIHRLHDLMTHYEPTSEVSQIGALSAGESVVVSTDVFECLQAAARASRGTGGAFDVTVGALVDCWRTPAGRARTPTDAELAAAKHRTGMHLLQLDASRLTVAVKVDRVRVNLSAIGKGYAVDRAAEAMRAYGFKAGLIHGGHSSVYALGAKPGLAGWPVRLADPEDRSKSLATLLLCDRGMGASGVKKPVAHIIDPRTGRPITGRLASWALAPTATEADALSTAFMVMSAEQVEQYCREHPEVSAMLVHKDQTGRRVYRFGRWPKP